MQKNRPVRKVHVFGEHKQWAISIDDGCLRFHPQYNEYPDKTSSWIWKEAFEEISKHGGFDAMREKIRNPPPLKENKYFGPASSQEDQIEAIKGRTPSMYRLCMKKPIRSLRNTAYILQGLFMIEDDKKIGGMEWLDLPTVIED